MVNCQHPASRRYAWRTYDDTIAVACCDCGAALKGAMTVDDFAPTHVIDVHWNDGRHESIPVHCDDGICYTEGEWNECAPADWTIAVNGDLLFLGQVPNCRDYGITRWYAAEIRP